MRSTRRFLRLLARAVLHGTTRRSFVRLFNMRGGPSARLHALNRQRARLAAPRSRHGTTLESSLPSPVSYGPPFFILGFVRNPFSTGVPTQPYLGIFISLISTPDWPYRRPLYLKNRRERILGSKPFRKRMVKTFFGWSVLLEPLELCHTCIGSLSFILTFILSRAIVCNTFRDGFRTEPGFRSFAQCVMCRGRNVMEFH